jgi:hypothetical protein
MQNTILVIRFLFFLYGFMLIGSYIVLGIISVIESIEYMKRTALLTITKYYPLTFLPLFPLLPQHIMSLNIIELPLR